jgi:hypothetical protein
MTATMKRTAVPATGDELANGRIVALVHGTWYAAPSEVPHTVVLATKLEGAFHPYAVWDLICREDGQVYTIRGSYFGSELEAMDEYRRRVEHLQKSRADYEVVLT